VSYHYFSISCSKNTHKLTNLQSNQCIIASPSIILPPIGYIAEVEETKLAAEAKHRKILSLKDENKRLSDALRHEKEKSRLTILNLMNEAEDVLAEANELKSIADEKMSAAE
jgi:hypothetical protein